LLPDPEGSASVGQELLGQSPDVKDEVGEGNEAQESAELADVGIAARHKLQNNWDQ